MIAPVYETCIVITICTDYSLWPLECCMDEGKAVNWGLANQIFMYKTSTKVIGRKESLKKKTLKQARQKTNTCSVEQYSRKKHEQI